jgi:hypothetical protein
MMGQGDQLRYGVGMAGIEAGRERTQADMLMQMLRDRMASQQGQGEWNFKEKELAAQRQAAAMEQLTTLATQNGGTGLSTMPPQMLQMLLQQAMPQAGGGQPGQPPAPPPPQGAAGPGSVQSGPGQQTIMPGNQGAQPFAPPNMDVIRSQNPAAMTAHTNQFTDPARAAREEAMTLIRGGNWQNNPAVRSYLSGILSNEDPNLAWGPDWMSYPTGASNTPSMLGWLTGQPTHAQRAAQWLHQHHGIPTEVGLPYAEQYYNSGF